MGPMTSFPHPTVKVAAADVTAAASVAAVAAVAAVEVREAAVDELGWWPGPGEIHH